MTRLPANNRPAPLPKDWFEAGDLVSRGDDDRHVVLKTNEQDGDPYPPDLIETLCVTAPGSGWCAKGDQSSFCHDDLTLIRRGEGTIGAPLKQFVQVELEERIEPVIAGMIARPMLMYAGAGTVLAIIGWVLWKTIENLLP